MTEQTDQIHQDDTKAKGPHLFARLRLRLVDGGILRNLAYVLAVASVVAGVGTVATMTRSGPEGADLETVLGLLYLDVTLLLALGALVIHRVINVWAARRKGLAGAKLHTRMVVLFSMVAVTPAILVAVFAFLFLDFGMKAWFSERVATAINESGAVAQAYFEEHQQAIRADVLAIASDLKRAPALLSAPRKLNGALNAYASLRGIPEVIVMDRGGKVLGRSELSYSLEFDLVPPESLTAALSGDVVLLANQHEERVRAVYHLGGLMDAYLVIGRFVAPKVLEHLKKTTRAVAQYKSLEQKRKGIQISFVLIFGVVALLLLLAAAWVGLSVATRLTTPVTTLIMAAERIRGGDMSVRVHTDTSEDEFGSLSRAFNRMTSQLEAQRQRLMDANAELDERRMFTETVLEGVSAGVIGLAQDGTIHLANKAASVQAEIDLDKHFGEPLDEVLPELSDLLAEARTKPDGRARSEITLRRAKRVHVLQAIIAAEAKGDDTLGYVVTFDDITDLQSAQRKAAWSGVARRIAHEIKNPLTPIQLSAERLNRKYLKEITSDPETFAACTQTIVRHVVDIGRMVDEFSSFARLPQPVMAHENLSEICRETVFFERNRSNAITIDMVAPDTDVSLFCDRQQITRVLTNLLKNAAESIEYRLSTENDGDSGWIQLRVEPTEVTDPNHSKIRIVIEDNGGGFPQELMHQLTEPYVTTREKGTGLGLAIVRKIMEDHEGEMILEDRNEGGARIVLTFQSTDPTLKASKLVSADMTNNETKPNNMTQNGTAKRMTTDGV